MSKKLIEKDATGLKELLRQIYAGIPYDLHTPRESFYHALFIMMAKASGYEVEVHTDKGRIDIVLKIKGSVFIIEFKYNKDKKSIETLLKEAITQLRDKKYHEKYASTDVTLLAIAFNKDKEIGCKFESV
ncbi:MAG: PD-(D/E)XK nuclease domain-containing protein [Endomicrobium sp.]|nr:PD-(D/E)XK nuclease domain-containing protein [Endomicrobium sp.]